MNRALEHSWQAALLAADLFADRPIGSGLWVRSGAGPVRDAFLDRIRRLVRDRFDMVRLPPTIPEHGLTGGIDLAATLRTGRSVQRRGLLAAANGTILVLGSAERVAIRPAGVLASCLETGRCERHDARFGLIVLDESEGDEAIPAALAERLGLVVCLDGIPVSETHDTLPGTIEDDDASPDEPGTPRAIAELSLALGIDGYRAPLAAIRVARQVASRAGRTNLRASDVAVALHLVLAPRATRLPQAKSSEPAPAPDPGAAAQAAQAGPPPERDPGPSGDGEGGPIPDGERTDAEVEVAPTFCRLTDLVMTASVERARASAGGRGEGKRAGALRGRPTGARPGLPRDGGRVDLAATLRSAAPWQRLRGRRAGGTDCLAIRASDLRVRQFEQSPRQVTIFAVDASGSAAAARLAEAKGAVEGLLADCYRRRDQVALIAFRGSRAELILPPTGALARARRCLVGLPGGGGTPLAHGLDAARALAERVRRRGETPFLVLLTDGRANVDRQGIGGRAQAGRDALASARAIAARRIGSIVVDLSARPDPAAAAIAGALAGRHVALPGRDASRPGATLAARLAE